jgi:hypothetical protein
MAHVGQGGGLVAQRPDVGPVGRVGQEPADAGDHAAEQVTGLLGEHCAEGK